MSTEYAAARENLLLFGTAGYMAPEQTRGEPADPRTDILCIRHRAPRVADGAPAGVDPSITESHRIWRAFLTAALRIAPQGDLLRWRAGRRPRIGFSVPERGVCRRAGMGAAAGCPGRYRHAPGCCRRGGLVVAIRAGAYTLGPCASRRLRSSVLADDGDSAAAFILAQQALVAAPGNPHLQQLWRDASVLGSFTTDPAGATVEFAEYRRARGAWQPLGTTPIADRRIPRGLVRVRVSKPGFQTIEASAAPPGVVFGSIRSPTYPPAWCGSWAVATSGSVALVRLMISGSTASK